MKDTKPSPIRFGIFEVDAQSGELRKQGFRVKLQDQPFQILMMLLARPGEVITREELQKELWTADTFVDFERGLNRAINKLREALADNADSPRFIETLPRRGYRFLMTVETVEKGEAGNDRSQVPIVTPVNGNLGESSFPAQVRWRDVVPWGITGLLAVIAIAAVWKSAVRVDRPFLQLDLALPADFTNPAISPDGRRIVFISNGALCIRRLDQANVARLAGTDGASYPFFSPNGQWVAYFASGKLQKIAVDGGAPMILCDAAGASGGSWGADDMIVAGLDANRGLSRVPATGGIPQPLTNAVASTADSRMHSWPQILPGGGSVLFAAIDGSWQGSLRVLTLNNHKIKTLVEGSTQGRYLDSGHLLYYKQGELLAAPMDLARLELTGPSAPLVRGVSKSGERSDFDLSASDTLIYRAGAAKPTYTVGWLYSSGKTEPVLTNPGDYLTPRLSPDGTRLAVAMSRSDKQNIWVYNLGRETWTRVTSDAGPELLPTWSPDGEYLAFRSGTTLGFARSDGSSNAEQIEGVSPNAAPWSFSPDGKWLAFWPLQPDSDVWAIRADRTAGRLRFGKPQILLGQAGSKGAPSISPDNRWVAYASAESGTFEIYVVPFSPEGVVRSQKWPVSSGGGWSPVFSRTGQKLFYQTRDSLIWVAAYSVRGDSFVVEKSRPWSSAQLATTGLNDFDIAPDGKRVLGLFPVAQSQPDTILHVMLNLGTELRRLAPKFRK